MQKYKEGLFNCIKPVLQVYGMNENQLAQLHNELVENQNML